MTHPLHIVVPMAGRGQRFVNAGFSSPKPLIPLGGKPMVQWVVENIRPSRPHVFVFLCLKEHLVKYPEVPRTLKAICPGCHIIEVANVTEGAACTVLLARDLIDHEAPLMIANSDQLVDWSCDKYLEALDQENCDGGMMTFWADDPKWSFCRLRNDGSISEVVEKEVVSNEATVGIYNFKRGADFVRAADKMIGKNLRVKGEFYVGPTYNELIEEGQRFLTVRVGRERDGMYGLGVPEDLAFFKTTPLYRKLSRE